MLPGLPGVPAVFVGATLAEACPPWLAGFGTLVVNPLFAIYISYRFLERVPSDSSVPAYAGT